MRDLEQFAELAKVGRVSDLSPAAVLRWNEELKGRKQASSSRARKLSALRAFVAWAQEYKVIASNPIPTELSLPKSFYLPHALSEAEVKAMLDISGGQVVRRVTESVQDSERARSLTSASNTKQARSPVSPAAVNIVASTMGKRAAIQHATLIRDHAIIEVLYASGMRVSELTGLRLVDLHLSEGFAIVTGKGSKQRLVPLGQYAIDALRDYITTARETICKSAPQHGEVFLSQRGPISRSQVFRMIKAVAARAGIVGKVSPHTFRHSCASHMLAHGADLRLVQELLGHSALSTTQVYTHIEKSRLRQVYDACHPMA